MKRESSFEDLTPTAAALAIAGSISAVTVAECLFRVLFDLALRSGASVPGLTLLYAPPVLLAIIGAIPLAYVVRQPAGSFVLGLASVTAAVFVVSNFRGSHRWPGFYDAPHQTRWPFIMGWIGALLLGALLTRGVSLKRLQALSLGLIGLAALWTWIDAFRGISLIMFIPYTRHIAIATVVMMALIAVLLHKRFSEQDS